MNAEEQVSPYPVLGNGRNFPDQTFSAENFRLELKGDRYEVDCEFRCENEHIAELVRSGRAHYCLELDCPSVPGSKEAFTTTKDRINFTVSADRVEDEIHLTPFVVAAEDINNYAPPGIHPDYADARFHVRKNERLAVDPAGKRAFNLWDTLESLIQIKRADSRAQKTARLLPTGGPLLVALPQREFDLWIGLRESRPEMHSILAHQYVTTALLAAIGMLAAEPDCDDKWARSLAKILEKRKVRPDARDPASAFELMQEILEKPFGRIADKAQTLAKETHNDE
jgi:hypothetical protein